MTPSYDVCAAVVSDLSTDARVWKEVVSLRDAGYSVALIGCRYDIDGVVRRTQDGVDVVEVSLGSRVGKVSLADRARTLLEVWRAVMTTSARVYHSHNIHVMPACWVASRRRRARLVYDAHELYGCLVAGDSAKRRAVRRIEMAAEAFAVKQSDQVITTNPSRVIALQARHGLRPIVVLANVPRPVGHIEPLDPGFPPGVPILLYQGGIYAEARSFAETIAALQYLPDVHFVILGFGREQDLELIRHWAAEGGVADRVHLLPALPFDQLVHTAALATVGLVPIKPVDLGHVLGDTNKLYEYLMAGLPVIASDMPEISRVVRHGATPVGEIFDPEDSRSIADAYLRVTEDGAEYARRRIEARRIATKVYHWGIEEQRLQGLYRRLLDSSRSR